jgi:peptidoglycan hydrolase-like protein with peptidoglycan-binding domain
MTITGMRLMQYQVTTAQPTAAVPAAPAVAAPVPAPASVATPAPGALFDWHAAQGRLSTMRNELANIRQQIDTMLKGFQPAPAPQPAPVAAPVSAPAPAPKPTKPAAPPKDSKPAPKPEPKPEAKPKPKPKPKPTGSGPTLKEGHGGKPVKALQQRLNKLGFNAGAVDGLFGNQTEAALKRFERKHGLKVDGVADKRVWNELGIKVKGKPQRIADMTVKTPDGPMVRRQGKLISASIAGKFDKMAAAAKKAGVTLQINNSYRSYQEQVVLWNRYGRNPARVAPPGTSNHQSGRAIDFVNTPGAYAWLKANAHKYGLHNYPPEPWHYSPTGSGAPGSAPGAETLEVIPIGL